MSESQAQSPLADRVAIAALVISTLALLGVVLQYVQAIIATAKGLPSRDKEVMGLWAPYVRLKWKFFRVEVEYEAPIIFLAPDDNKNGPVDTAIWYVTGTRKSCVETRVEEPPLDPEDVPPGQDDVPLGNSGLTRERVHTVKNELATWILVISAVQKMERDSRNWESRRWQPTPLEERPDPPERVTLAINIQAMKRSFERHPTFRRPYATTAICHIIELCAVLGIYWKEFDRDENRYRAEGNGYSVLGTRVSDFGLVFTFEKPGWPRFKKNRVIPTAEVKELCFGNVPTFYRPREDDENWRQPINEQTDLMTLQLGSRTEIAETLNLIRCNEYTTQCYSDETKKHAHLFPVIFEVVGMLARPLHLINRPFTYLPNPVAFSLNKQAFSPRRLLAEFSERLGREITTHAKYTPPSELKDIDDRADELNKRLPAQDGDYSPLHLNDLHEAINSIDSKILDPEKNAKDIVLDVLRRHVQEVLLAINTSAKDMDGGGDNSPATRAGLWEDSPTNRAATETPIKGEISFDDLLKVPHEKRESSLLDRYFDEIRVRAVTTSSEHHDPQAAAASRFIHGQESGGQQEDGHSPGGLESLAGDTGGTSGPPERPVQSPPVSGTTSSSHHSSRRRTGLSRLSRSETLKTVGLGPTEVRRNTIWCALVFRMICWLLLHDFDKKDVQLPKSELLGSRLSVFIV
ncbi:hypothetical protein MFIFM68171_08568 [Madurella fahalii]|uniref:Modin n=1 Tax=Madurella fahalii TaxID=1157608 RepID=A0ABQ0GKS6_9PEZI